MRKKLTGYIVAFALLLGGGIATMSGGAAHGDVYAAAEKSWDWENDYQSTSRSGQTYTGTKVDLSTDGTYKWVYTVGYSAFSVKGTVAELKEGLLFQCLPNEANTNWATDLVVTFKDATNNDLQVSYIISGGTVSGEEKYTLYTTLGTNWERKDNYGYWVDSIYNDDNDAQQRIPINSHDAYKVNELGTNDYDKNQYSTIFSKDGDTNTTALKFAVKGDGLYFQGSKKSNIADSSLFTSGNVVAELTFINFTYETQSIGDGAAINMISFGSRSLAKLTSPSAPKLHTLTTTVNGTVTTKTYIEGKKVALSEPTVGANKVFVGWKIDENIYSANYTVTMSGDVSAEAVVVSFYMTKGASIRIDSSKLGIRWQANIFEEDKAKFSGLNAQYGLKVTEAETEGYLDIVADKWLTDSKYSCVMTDLTTEDINRKFTGQAYVYVTYADGTHATIWATAKDNERSIYDVAKAFYDDTEDPEQQELLETLVGNLSGES